MRPQKLITVDMMAQAPHRKLSTDQVKVTLGRKTVQLRGVVGCCLLKKGDDDESYCDGRILYDVLRLYTVHISM